MTNTALLEDLIQKSGLKKSYLAEKAGMSLAWFRAWCINKGEFRESQMDAIESWASMTLHFLWLFFLLLMVHNMHQITRT